MEYHERQLDIGIVYRNYCWVPRQKRLGDGSSNWIKRIPAAIECGLTDRVWTSEDMVLAADEFIARRGGPEAPLAPSNEPTRRSGFGWSTNRTTRKRGSTRPSVRPVRVV